MTKLRSSSSLLHLLHITISFNNDGSLSIIMMVSLSFVQHESHILSY